MKQELTHPFGNFNTSVIANNVDCFQFLKQASTNQLLLNIVLFLSIPYTFSNLQLVATVYKLSGISYPLQWIEITSFDQIRKYSS